MNDKSSRGCERSVVDRILMNRAILARPDTDYHHPASIGYRVVFLPEIHRITLQSGPPPIRVSRIFDLVPFLSLSLVRHLSSTTDERKTLSLSLFPSSLCLFEAARAHRLDTNEIIKVLAYNSVTRAQERSFSVLVVP